MNIDKRKLYSLTFALFILISLGLLVPWKMITLYLLLILGSFMVLIIFFIKKRGILSINKKQVLFLSIVIAILYLMIYYLSGIKYGFLNSQFRFSFNTLYLNIIPTTLIVVFLEKIRSILIIQNNKIIDIFTYLIAILVDFHLVTNLTLIKSFNQFMDLFGITLLPALLFNLMYHNFSKRYGCGPNIAFRIIILTYPFIIPFVPNTPDALLALCKVLSPLIIMWFITVLYQGKSKKAIEKKSKLGHITFATVFVIMILFVMLISNQFRYGAIVIATDSMQNEINSGDVIIFEKTDNNDILEIGQVIVFEKNDILVVHRVVDIEYIDNELRYYTKGDANESNDEGFVTQNEILGFVNFKVSYLGYPTIWLRDLFN